MDEGFELPVMYRGKELLLPAQMVQTGYRYKVEVEMEQVVIAFEKDEEGAWRAIAPEELPEGRKLPPIDLIEATVASLEQHF